MKRRSLNPAVVMGIVLGASLGGIIAVMLMRRSKRARGVGLREIPWKDIVVLSGPVIALSRRLLEMSRREVAQIDR